MKISSLLAALLLLLVPVLASAQNEQSSNDGVELNVNVIERKPTDTMNDFQTPTFFDTTAQQGQVLGAQTQKNSVREKSANKTVEVVKTILYLQLLPWWVGLLFSEKILSP